MSHPPRSVSGLLFSLCAAALASSLSPATAHAQAQEQSLSARSVTWTCTSSPCPWGSSSTARALVWPDGLSASESRLGYTTSEAIYLPAARANGVTLTLSSGMANVYAGEPGAASHRVIAVLRRGEPQRLGGLDDGEVVSVQSSAGFDLTFRGTGSYYPEGVVIPSIHAFWRCTQPGCTDPDWTGEVITWPAWSAYQTNARTSWNSRAVFDGAGNPLYPYMGTWAQGCKVTAHSGVVLIIEWERGKDVWRETKVYPGETHTITLHPPENNAMIETVDGEPAFSASLENCNPQPLP